MVRHVSLGSFSRFREPRSFTISRLMRKSAVLFFEGVLSHGIS